MIFRISWAADRSRSETVWFWSGMVPSCHINNRKFGEFMFGQIIIQKLIFTSDFSSVLFGISYSVTQGVAKDFTSQDHPLLKSLSPWPARIGGPRNPQSLNLPELYPYLWIVDKIQKYIGILQNRFRFVDIFLILYSWNSIWGTMHDG